MHPEEIVEAGGIILTLLDTLFLTTNGCVMWVSGTRQEKIQQAYFYFFTYFFTCLVRGITPVDLVTSAHIIHIIMGSLICEVIKKDKSPSHTSLK